MKKHLFKTNMIVTLSGFDRAELLFKIAVWAPTKARSFSILQITRENYSVVTRRRNKMLVDLIYFPNRSGKYQIPKGVKPFPDRKDRFHLQRQP